MRNPPYATNCLSNPRRYPTEDQHHRKEYVKCVLCEKVFKLYDSLTIHIRETYINLIIDHYKQCFHYFVQF
jgi:hypothetical protein